MDFSESDIVSGLEDFGFSENEVRVYINFLRFGAQPASVIATKSGLKRSNTQFICKKLKDKGVLTSVKRNNVIIYSACDPSVFSNLLTIRQNELLEKTECLKDLVAKLFEIKAQNAILPDLEYFEGADSVNKAYCSILSEIFPDEIIRCYSNVLSEHPDMYKYIEKRLKKKIFIRVISTEKSVFTYLKKLDKKKFRETRFFAKAGKTMKDSEIFIYGPKVVIISWKKGEEFSYVLKHKEISQLQADLFDLQWKM